MPKNLPSFSAPGGLDRRQWFKAAGLGAGALATAAWASASPGESPASLRPSEIGYRDGEYVLPPLPYAYDALERAIDARTMELHHDLHHRGYVNGANRAMEHLGQIASGEGDASLTKHWERELAFHGSGHTLHLLFWNNMSPDGGGTPEGELARQIDDDFGGFEAFSRLFQSASTAVEASGWGILGWEPVAQRLVVLQAEKHHNLTVHGVQPILAIDVWEHAYYLRYQNRRSEYVAAFMEVIDWRYTGQLFERVRTA